MNHTLMSIGDFPIHLLRASPELNCYQSLAVQCKILLGQARGDIDIGDILLMVVGNDSPPVVTKIPPFLSCFGNAPNGSIDRLSGEAMVKPSLIYYCNLVKPRATKLGCVYGILRSGPDLCFPAEPRVGAK